MVSSRKAFCCISQEALQVLDIVDACFLLDEPLDELLQIFDWEEFDVRLLALGCSCHNQLALLLQKDVRPTGGEDVRIDSLVAVVNLTTLSWTHSLLPFDGGCPGMSWSPTGNLLMLWGLDSMILLRFQGESSQQVFVKGSWENLGSIGDSDSESDKAGNRDAYDAANASISMCMWSPDERDIAVVVQDRVWVVRINEVVRIQQHQAHACTEATLSIPKVVHEVSKMLQRSGGDLKVQWSASGLDLVVSYRNSNRSHYNGEYKVISF